MKKIDERVELMKENKLCFKCGSPFKRNKNRIMHMCSWKDGKKSAKCTGAKCWNAAAMCNNHSDNASQELMDWLGKNNTKFIAEVVIASPPRVNCQVNLNLNETEAKEFLNLYGTFKGTFEERLNKFHNRGEKKQTPVDSPIDDKTRKLLQSGEVSKMMSDDEIHQHLSADMRKFDKNAIVHGIPDDPVFIFCIFKGMKRDIQVFIDSGCNCWLSLDGIPQEELDSVKVKDGPIPLGIASGKTAYAKAEWASLLPLNDGTYQCVRGLTMDRVTSDMPTYDLNSTLEMIRQDCADDNEKQAKIKNIRVPKMVGGRIHMILGLKYQSIYPVPIHTMANGLTLFESKLRPSEPGLLACIGGPVKHLESLCTAAGEDATFSYISCLVNNMNDYKFTVDFFPGEKRFDP